MRYVTLTRLGTPSCEGASITIPYNGEAFEFLDDEWRGLARRAAAAGEGYVVRVDHRIARVHKVTTPE